MSQEEFNEDQSELEGFTEIDTYGVSHRVSWEIAEIVPDTEYETWWCQTHDRIYYGGCDKVGKPYGR